MLTVRPGGPVGGIYLYATAGRANMTATEAGQVCEARAAEACKSLFKVVGPYSCTTTQHYTLSAIVSEGYANALLIQTVLVMAAAQMLQRWCKSQTEQDKTCICGGTVRNPSPEPDATPASKHDAPPSKALQGKLPPMARACELNN